MSAEDEKKMRYLFVTIFSNDRTNRGLVDTALRHCCQRGIDGLREASRIARDRVRLFRMFLRPREHVLEGKEGLGETFVVLVRLNDGV